MKLAAALSPNLAHIATSTLLGAEAKAKSRYTALHT